MDPYKTKAHKGTVVLYMPHLVHPPYQGNLEYRATPPLSLLALAGALRVAGYRALLLDAKWDVDYLTTLDAVAADAVCLGISCMAGYSVGDGLRVAQFVRQKFPDLPIVWGGWHPSFADLQAIAENGVDVVVRDQGERSFVEVLDALRERRSLRSVAGITYLEGDEVVRTVDRPAEDINNFTGPDYSIVDVNRYIQRRPGGLAFASTIASRGCPYRCDFCLDSRTSWSGLNMQRLDADLRSGSRTTV